MTFINRKAAELKRTDHFAFLVGYADGTFGPERNMTRAEVTTMFARLLTEQIEVDKTYSNTFSDVPDTYWAARYINFAATRGWVTGYSDGTFKPENPITRAEVAAVTCRLLERSADQSYIRSHLKELRTFADMTESHWAYWYAMEAANGHDYTKSGGSENWSRAYR